MAMADEKGEVNNAHKCIKNENHVQLLCMIALYLCLVFTKRVLLRNGGLDDAVE